MIGGDFVVFVVGAATSLTASWLLVSRLERMAARFGLSEALLGLVVALAADTPEISSAVTALVHGQRAVGAGVAIGSNVFNLAALLGLAAAVSGTIVLHRRVVLFTGVVGGWIALVCLATVLGWIPAGAGFALAFAALAVDVALASAGAGRIARQLLPRSWRSWLVSENREVEEELEEMLVDHRRSRFDPLVGLLAVVVVVVASVAMERAASAIGRRYDVAGILIGGLVLAAVTSLPNAVGAIYLARRRRGAALFSTALNSNAANAAFGFLLPATVVGIGARDANTVFVAAWYVVLTLLAVAFALRDRALRRGIGILVIAAYGVFCASLVVGTRSGAALATTSGSAGLVVLLVAGVLLRARARRRSLVRPA